VKNISRHTLAFCFITPKDANKLGSKALKNISINDIQKLNSKETDPKKIKAMKKYKDKVNQRLQTKNINPKDLINSK
jgi:hypothetical protein